MSDTYDPDERFTLAPAEAEDVLRTLLGADGEPGEESEADESPEDEDS